MVFKITTAGKWASVWYCYGSHLMDRYLMIYKLKIQTVVKRNLSGVYNQRHLLLKHVEWHACGCFSSSPQNIVYHYRIFIPSSTLQNPTRGSVENAPITSQTVVLYGHESLPGQRNPIGVPYVDSAMWCGRPPVQIQGPPHF